MNDLRGKLWAKIVAFLLLVILLVIGIASAAATVYLYSQNAYRDDGEQIFSELTERYVWEGELTLRNLLESVLDGQMELDKYTRENVLYNMEHSMPNYLFSVQDGEGNPIISSRDLTVDMRYESHDQFSVNLRQLDPEPEKAIFDGGEVSAYEQAWDYISQLRDVNEVTWQVLVRPISSNVEGTDADGWILLAEETASDGPIDYRDWELCDGFGLDPGDYGFSGDTLYGQDLDAAGQLRLACEVTLTRSVTETITIDSYVPSVLNTGDRLAEKMDGVSLLLQVKDRLLVIAVACILLSVLLFVFLMCAAGRKAGVEGIYLYWVDKIPLDLLAAVLVGFSLLTVVIGFDWLGYSNYLTLSILAMVAVVAFVICCVVGVLCSTAARVKRGKWWKNTVIYLVLNLLWRITVKLAFGISKLTLSWKTALGWVGFCIVEFILYNLVFYSGGLFPMWLVIKILLTVFIGFLLYNMDRLKRGGEQLAAGDLETKIDTANLFGDFKRHAENLNSLGHGMQLAVEERTRSERMKTELITNVSHDIKTPLTSIVNYVDLLKKEDVQPETARTYIDVLDRQSARLKKLIEDLVEASKASTGALKVTMRPTDVSVLLNQAVGEYAERFEKANLTPVLDLPEDPVVILADGRYLWRVFDNLLGNICKYTMPGTRVYMFCVREGENAVISFKNISENMLNISSDELFERFTRGDASRHTEGSGLGLSIARSLVQLQNGTIDITVDGDLFKVTITFGLLGPEQG
ncbi:MAG: hypothetical protein IJ052_09410 [Oscillospiraceae bacterium]|nr:hypothetical protein [Oscillospiraceae bacterium]